MHRTLLTISVGRVLRGPGGRSPPGIGGWGSGLLRAGDDGQSARLGLNHLGDGAGVHIVSAGQIHQVLQVVDEILNQEVITGGPGLVNAMTDIIDSGVEVICEFTHCGSVLPRAASGGSNPVIYRQVVLSVLSITSILAELFDNSMFGRLAPTNSSRESPQ